MKNAAIRLGKRGTGLSDAEIAKELTAPLSRPNPPTYFNHSETNEFERFCDKLESLGVLSFVDEDTIIMIAETSAELRKARADLNARGSSHYETKTGSGGINYKFYPEYFIVRELVKELAALMKDFGLTPAARSRVATNPINNDEENKFDAY
jgi:P27 family predicted phage terminase small subunit